ncbi:pyridoxal phosphate-dependent aminotransferase [Croceicoccus mobilis]|uniref:Histidinol-phosphate aminotransferase n=1 Tax=Croceicoccus mobilis TaxID=1703339 RepID=A0A917E022_9SPHN|nr:aminotransferase class I/II-fold pyridoxal phosphate-dependent enzyme [Croceicoccus mobilis]GGD83771.1 histidinol-phosphate aminotransferase [Croceicoccus mobilis]
MELSRRRMLTGTTIGGAALVGSSAMAQTATAPAKDPSVFGPPPGVAQLSRNENPFGPAPSAIQAIYDEAKNGCYYANGGVEKLTGIIASHYSLSPDNITISSGSTEVLCAAALALPDGKAILCPELFWDTTVKYAERKGATLKRVPLAEDMSVDLDAMAKAIGPDVGMIQICNPNNPTGMATGGAALRSFIQNVPADIPILVDEAYNELTSDPAFFSVSDMVNDHPNLIVCRTFSKIFGMAGLRVGYALSHPDTAMELRSYLMSFGGNTAGLSAAIASFEDETFKTYSKYQVLAARKIIMDAVTGAGLTALPSETNFVYVKVPDADALQKAMAENGVSIRGAYGKWTNWSRVSCGYIEDVKRYAELLPQLV